MKDTLKPYDPYEIVSRDFLAELDRGFQVWLSTMTAGVSPASMNLAYADWVMQLALSPGKVMGLWLEGWGSILNFKPPLFFLHDLNDEPCINPLPRDKRFRDEAWSRFPFNYYQQSFLSFQQWWREAASEIKGVNEHHTEVVKFVNNQLLDAVAPSNFIATNPIVLQEIRKTFGLCLLKGFWHYVNDAKYFVSGKLPEHLQPFTIGKDLALTPGKVVYRNRLMELIQYSPTTDEVYAEPVLIVPAWIMKYYILDLTPNQSLVEYLVNQGHTVFLISWKNPTADDHDLGFNDYMKLSVIESLDIINEMVPHQKIHAAGYCIGGILLTVSAAWLSRLQDDRLQSITLLAAQTDFDRAGELLLFIDDSQLAFLNNIMQHQGYLDKYQMKTIFQMMRSNDLIWAYMINHYLRGQRTKVTELMAWSSDATRMPYKMHKEYLEKLYLHDELSEGHYQVDGKEISLGSIKSPIFCVATEADYISPWRSVYQLHVFAKTDITFVLTNGGHNAGIVSRLNHPRRHYQIGTTKKEAQYISPDEWLVENPTKHAGSWWTEWHRWLAERSSVEKILPPAVGNENYPALCDAPGTYVYQK